jgi:hypothetical protein
MAGAWVTGVIGLVIPRLQSPFMIEATLWSSPLSLRQRGTYHYICISFLRSQSAKTKYKRKIKYRCEDDAFPIL